MVIKVNRVFDSSSSSSRKDVGVDWLERALPEAVSWCLSPGTTDCKTLAGLERQLGKLSATKYEKNTTTGPDERKSLRKMNSIALFS